MTYMIIGLIVGVIIAGVSGWLMQQSGTASHSVSSSGSSAGYSG